MENKTKTDEGLMKDWATSSEGGMKFVSVFDKKSGARKTYLQKQLAVKLEDASDPVAKIIVFIMVGAIFGMTWLAIHLV